MAKIPERGRVDAALYATLRAIHHFERDLCARFGLGYTEICLLQLLRRNPGLRVGQAASVLELAHFSATRLVQRLEAEGLLIRGFDPEDRRAVLLTLSEKARRLIQEIEDRSYGLVQDYAAGRTDAEVAKFIAVAENLDKVLGVANRAGEAVEKT